MAKKIIYDPANGHALKIFFAGPIKWKAGDSLIIIDIVMKWYQIVVWFTIINNIRNIYIDSRFG